MGGPLLLERFTWVDRPTGSTRMRQPRSIASTSSLAYQPKTSGPLRGKMLMFRCAFDADCHADSLLEAVKLMAI